MDNQINGNKWIIFNKNEEEEQVTIYLKYKDYKDIYPENPEIPERYAHYYALIPEIKDILPAKTKIQLILNKIIEKRQFDKLEQNKVKIMIWNSNSIRDFTIKSFFIQQIYENKIDIALIQETMLKENDAFYIKNYRIFRANSKFRRGVAIIISKQLDCDAYKIIEDTEGRYL